MEFNCQEDKACFALSLSVGFLLLLFYSTSVCNNKDDDEIRGLVKHLCSSVLSSYCFIFLFY